MFSATFFHPLRFQWSEVRTYFFITLFSAGNLILPQLCHLVPSGGQILLPIYFFTLVASYKFGLKVGLATALLSPLLNSVLFGMPTAAVLPAILIKSTLLAVMASFVADRYRKLSIFYLLIVILGYQFAGSLVEWGITQSYSAAIADITKGIPGMLVQLFGGFFLLKKMSHYEQG